LIWPWQESRLIILVSGLALLDFISTVTALNLSSRYGAQEVGILAKWAFNLGGFPGLFLMNAAAIGTLVLFATMVRAIFRRFGFSGFGRSAFVFLFVPYAVIIVPVIINNFFITFVR
jgi:hypothetical protein